MTKFTFATICGGLGGGTFGAIQAGGIPLWNIDKDPRNPEASKAIGEAYTANFNSLHIHETVEDAAKLVQEKKLYLPVPDLLLVTYSCIEFSLAALQGSAKAKDRETEKSLDALKAIAYFIRLLNPGYTIFENVPQWANSQSWMNTKAVLWQLSNYIDGDETPYLATDFGVPQGRKRLLIRCAKSPLPPLTPSYPHTPGCIEAIADLLPHLPDAELTKAQKAVYPEEDCVIERVGYRDKGPRVRFKDQPVFTIKASLADDGKNKREKFLTICHGGSFKNVTPEVLLRWQGFPDDTILPKDLRYAVRGIGNAVPPPMVKAAVESLSITPKPHSFISYYRDPQPQIETVKAIWDYHGQPDFLGIYLRTGIIPLALNPPKISIFESEKTWYDIWFSCAKNSVDMIGICDNYNKSRLVSIPCVDEQIDAFSMSLFKEKIQHWNLVYANISDTLFSITPEDFVYIEIPRMLDEETILTMISRLKEFSNPIVISTANCEYSIPWSDYGFHHDLWSEVAVKNLAKSKQDISLINLNLEEEMPIVDTLSSIM